MSHVITGEVDVRCDRRGCRVDSEVRWQSVCAVCGDGMEVEVATWKINKGTEVIQQEDYKDLVPEERSE